MPREDNNRRSVYLSEEALKLLKGFDSLSGRLNNVLERYDASWRESLPELSKNEWCAICDANNGTIFDQPSIMIVWANVADSPDLEEKWGIKLAPLVKKLRALAKPQAVAVIEAIETFWRNHELPTDEALAVAGVIPREK
jgi:hypothetical protein